MLDNVTQREITALGKRYNLSDGNVYRHWTKSEQAILSKSGDIFMKSDRARVRQIEREYITLFLTMARQDIDFEHNKFLLCTSASMAIDIIANYLRLQGKSLHLIEPCFDSLSQTFKRHHVPLHSFPDEALGSESFYDHLHEVRSGAIFLVCPNNPTGSILSEDKFRALAWHCAQNRIIMIVDCCFRAYVPPSLGFDQYRVLKESGADYILIEDTGKTWYTCDLKAPFLATTTSLFPDIFSIHTDLLLNVSPFIIELLTEFMRLEVMEGTNHTIDAVVTNRATLYDAIQGTPLEPAGAPYCSLAWIRVQSGFTGSDIVRELGKRDIHILPGDYFFWSDRHKGAPYVRIALAREPEAFSEAAVQIGAYCRALFQS